MIGWGIVYNCALKDRWQDNNCPFRDFVKLYRTVNSFYKSPTGTSDYNSLQMPVIPIKMNWFVIKHWFPWQEISTKIEKGKKVELLMCILQHPNRCPDCHLCSGWWEQEVKNLILWQIYTGFLFLCVFRGRLIDYTLKEPLYTYYLIFVILKLK